MKNVMRLLVVLLAIGVSGFMMAGACEDITEACGPCGKLEYGDATISGDARLDGFFKALGTISARTGSIRANFDANVMALAEAFDISLDGVAEADIAGHVAGEIQAQIDASIQGSLSVNYQPPKCSADINVAVEAQAQCEAKAECEVEVDPGEVSVKCEGSCTGGCEGGCEGEMKCEASITAEGTCSGECSGSCELSGPSLNCEGTCKGECVVEGNVECTGSCDGTCSGGCDGTCSAENASGECEGSCDGTCNGNCEGTCTAQVEAECSGECNGKCEYTPPDGQCEGSCKGECTATVEAEADCEGEVKCEGSCSGSCSGGCEGNATPPSASANCEASADCQASAKAQASAELKCTPPSLEIGFQLQGALAADAQAKAEFMAKMAIYKEKMIAIAQGLAEVKGLFEGSAGVESPVAMLKGELQGLGESALTGEFDVSAGLIGCTLDAIAEVGGVVSQIGADASATIEGSASFMAVIGK